MAAGPNQPLYEGIAALAAAALVGALLWQMLRMGRHMKARIESQIGHAVGAPGSPPGAHAVAAVALVTALLVTREGLEAVFYLGVQALALRASHVPAQAALVVVGACLGLLGAGLLAWFWSHYSSRLNLGVVLKVTAVFLGIFLVQLVIYGVHELAESGVIHGSQGFHDATEVLGPQGRIGQLMSYSLVVAPLIYLVWARQARGSKPAGSTPARRVSAALARSATSQGLVIPSAEPQRGRGSRGADRSRGRRGFRSRR